MLFLAIVFGLVFGSQAYSVVKKLIFPEYYRGFWGLKLGLWMMCVTLDGFIVHKLWWSLFIIGAVHLLIFIIFINGGCDYLSTPLHPKGKREK